MPSKDPKKRAEWYQKNKVARDEYCKQWRANKRDYCIDLLGGKCNHCGIDDKVVLAFDHINNDGSKLRFKAGSTKLYNDIEELQEQRYQLLCHNCNWRKEYYRRKENALQKCKASKNYGGGSPQSEVRQESGDSG